MANIIELGPYIEGVNLVDPLTKLSIGELSQCLNIRTGVRGNLYKRPGHSVYANPTALQSGHKINLDNLVNLILRYYKSDGSRLLIAAAGGKLKFGSDVTGLWTDISINGSGASMEAVLLADWMVYKNRIYITDGINPQRYNGTDDIYAGYFVHTAPVLAQAVGGNLTLLATYKYFVTSVTNDMGEGVKGAEASFTLTGSNNQINLSSISVAPAKHEEVTKKIYRTKANGSLFYLLAEIGTAITIYNDTKADSILGAEFVPTHAPRSDCRFIIVGHDERTYWFGRAGANASLVEVSEVGFPDRIRDADFFSVANNDGDIITGGGLVPGGIVFFKRTSMWLSRGFGFGLINIYPKEKRGAGVGSTSHFSIVTTPIGLIFLSQRGEIYKFDGTNIEEIGRKVASEFKGMTTAAMNRIIACYHDYRYIISYDYRGSKGYNWRTLEYDTVAGKWEGPHENGDFYNPSYYSVWDSALDKGELYWGEAKAANGSYAYGRTEFSKTDRGNRFLSLIRTGAIPLSKLGEVKSIKFFIHGTFASSAALIASHIDKSNNKTSVNLNVPIAFVSSKLDGTDDLGPGSPVFKLGGAISDVMEGSLGPGARARTPIYEISDDTSGVEVAINTIELLVEALSPK